MENSPFGKIEISKNQFFQAGISKKPVMVSQDIFSEVQFLENRTNELRTVLNEIDEILNRIRREQLNRKNL